MVQKKDHKATNIPHNPPNALSNICACLGGEMFKNDPLFCSEMIQGDDDTDDDDEGGILHRCGQ